jgi:hypothetical protein
MVDLELSIGAISSSLQLIDVFATTRFVLELVVQGS